MTISNTLKLTAATLAAFAMAGTASAKIATGSQVSDIQVTDSNGTVHNLSDFAGKNVVLEWTNEGCPYVKKHYKSGNMQDLQKQATADGDTVWLSVISSAPGKQGYKTAAQANAHVVETGATPTAVILDEAGQAGRTFSAKTTPHMYVINADQTLVYQGAIDDDRSANPAKAKTANNFVMAALDSVKAGTPIATVETAPYGCSVKYGS